VSAEPSKFPSVVFDWYEIPSTVHSADRSSVVPWMKMTTSAPAARASWRLP
jgi:hypothetical protein